MLPKRARPFVSRWTGEARIQVGINLRLPSGHLINAEHKERFFKKLRNRSFFSFFDSALSGCHSVPKPQPKKGKGMIHMIVRFDPRPEDLQRLQVGPIGPHLPSFATLVSEQGYCNVTGWLKVRLVATLSRWLQQRRVPLRELNETRIASFFNARWKRLKRHVGDQTTMALLLRHLREANVVPPPPAPNSDINLICVDYEGFLLRERSV